MTPRGSNDIVQLSWGGAELAADPRRFAYLDASGGLDGVHTVDEHMVRRLDLRGRVKQARLMIHQEGENFFEQVRWFMNLIVNVDESREL